MNTLGLPVLRLKMTEAVTKLIHRHPSVGQFATEFANVARSAARTLPPGGMMHQQLRHRGHDLHLAWWVEGTDCHVIVALPGELNIPCEAKIGHQRTGLPRGGECQARDASGRTVGQAPRELLLRYLKHHLPDGDYRVDGPGIDVRFYRIKGVLYPYGGVIDGTAFPTLSRDECVAFFGG